DGGRSARLAGAAGAHPAASPPNRRDRCAAHRCARGLAPEDAAIARSCDHPNEAERVKLNILSDLHLGVGGLDHPRNDADVVILAGDITRPREAAAWALGFDRPVLYVPGNHEFYGGSIEGTIGELQRLCAGTHVHVLDDAEIVIDGVRFLGSTLWTDFRLFDDERRAASKAEAQRLMRDFSRITLAGEAGRVF